jgi:hypothetical protein
MILGKYSAAGVAGVKKDGFAKREAAARALGDSLGGTTTLWSWLRSSTWDFMAIGDYPSADGAIALGLIGRPTGAFEAMEIIEMLDSSELDRIAAAANKATYQPPGTLA